jgi:hypothetical protein
MTRNSHEIRYQPLADSDAALCFPCDAMGRVTMDALSDRLRDQYLFARALVGCVYARAVVTPALTAH